MGDLLMERRVVNSVDNQATCQLDQGRRELSTVVLRRITKQK